jgi:hypothetical protein
MFDCLGLKLCPGNPISSYSSVECSKEVLCIEDLGELIDVLFHSLRRDPDTAENSASAKLSRLANRRYASCWLIYDQNIRLPRKGV